MLLGIAALALALVGGASWWAQADLVNVDTARALLAGFSTRNEPRWELRTFGEGLEQEHWGILRNDSGSSQVEPIFGYPLPSDDIYNVTEFILIETQPNGLENLVIMQSARTNATGELWPYLKVGRPGPAGPEPVPYSRLYPGTPVQTPPGGSRNRPEIIMGGYSEPVVDAGETTEMIIIVAVDPAIPSSSVSVRMLYDGNQQPWLPSVTTGFTLDTDQFLTDLVPGKATLTFTASVTVPATVPPGYYLLEAVAIQENGSVVDESNRWPYLIFEAK